VITGFGGVFLAAGLVLLGPARADTQREHREVQAAPLIDARSIDQTPPGTRVLANGRLAPGPALGAHGLALYVRQQYEGSETTGGNKGRPRWREVERTTPAFDLATEGGVVPVTAGDYQLQAPPREVAPDGGPVGGATRLDLRVIDLSTERLIGFAPGDPATVDGVLQFASGQGRALRAARVFGGGDAAAYRATRAADVQTTFTLGAVFSGIGALGLTGGAWLLVRTRARGAARAHESPLT